MKKIISAALALTVGAISAIAAPITIKDVKDIANDRVYILKREGATKDINGFIYAKDVREGSQIIADAMAKVDTTQAVARFSIHYSEREKAYYLYNLGAERFVSGNSTKKLAIVTSASAEFTPIFNPTASYWIFLCGGYVLGSSDDNGTSIFLDDMRRAQARKAGTHFTLYESTSERLSKEQIDAIEVKVSEGRAAKIKEYRDFLKNAALVVNTGDLPRYIGEYDLEALTYALDHESDYSLKELEEIYNETVLGRFPKEGRYYRIHNGYRPVEGERKSNAMATRDDGTLFVRSLEYGAYGTATDGCSDDLNLFSVHYDGGDATQLRLRATAFNQYLLGGANQEKVTLTNDPDNATVYSFDYTGLRYKRINFYLPSSNTYLTVTADDDHAVWGYAKEKPSEWYLEEIKTIAVPVDANGYAAFCLPCGTTAPEGTNVYTLKEIAQGKAYLQAIPTLIPAYTPVIVKTTPGAENIQLTVGDHRITETASAMTGNVRKTTSTPGRYVPTFSADGVKFTYAPASDEPAMPGSCYVVSDDLGDLTTVVNEEVQDRLDTISIDDADPSQLYDLHGRAVKGNLRPGIYIDANTHKSIRVN